MTPSRARSQTAFLMLAASVLTGCRSSPRPDSGAVQAADAARIQRAVDDHLRALFPEVEGDLSRASIARALIEGTAADPGGTDVPTASIAAIRLGDYPLARGLLGELVAKNEVVKAREFLRQGDERSAIAVLDRAVATAPDSAALLTLRADAELVVATESHDLDFARSALEDYREAAKKRGGARALLGASRAARALGLSDEALAHARAGLDALDGADLELSDSLTPERVLAEASLGAYGQGAQGGAGGELARESVTALHASIARAPEDPWAWRALSKFELESGDATSARRTAGRGLQLFPADSALHATLFDALASIGGSAAIGAEYERFAAAHPAVGLARWNLARARFAMALDALDARRADAALLFSSAELEFARARTLASSPATPLATTPTTAQAGAPSATFEAECARQIALCRTGTGFARLGAGEIDAARDAFLSVEDASRGGLAFAVLPRLKSGVEGLAAVGDAYAAASNQTNAATIEALERAARIFNYLHEYDRTNVTFAIRCATSNRDAAVAIEIEARSLASQKKIVESHRHSARARELMQTSLAGFTAAIALAPDDAEVATDAGYVLANYLQRDPDTAEGWLTHAVKLFEARVSALTARRDEPGLDPAQKRARSRDLEGVESSLSDAYECLGVLSLTLKGDAIQARKWFEASLASSPEPREAIRGPGGWLDRCRAAIESKTDERVSDEKRWGAPLRLPDREH